MRNRSVRLCWYLGFILILAPLLGGRPQTRVEEHQEISHNILCTIQVLDGEWTPAACAIVCGKVESLSH
jgi:hypothetical protein